MNILLKHLVTEKANYQSELSNKYHFIVDTRANKIQIKNAIKEKYNVEVVSVNTIKTPRKRAVKHTKKGLQHINSTIFKKAIVEVKEGSEIDVYNNAI